MAPTWTAHSSFKRFATLLFTYWNCHGSPSCCLVLCILIPFALVSLVSCLCLPYTPCQFVLCDVPLVLPGVSFRVFCFLAVCFWILTSGFSVFYLNFAFLLYFVELFYLLLCFGPWTHFRLCTCFLYISAFVNKAHLSVFFPNPASWVWSGGAG